MQPMNDNGERLELLSVSLLEQQHDLVEQMREISEVLGIGLGWHYLLDLPWAAQEIHARPEMLIIDAGAGRGAMQWWLAEQGTHVISVDRTSRATLPHRFRAAYQIIGLREEDLANLLLPLSLRDFLPPRYPRFWKNYPAKLRTSFKALSRQIERRGGGTVYVYNQDLRTMTDIQSNSVDAVVSISALEHNHPDELKACISELMRVLKPGGRLVATLAAARDNDWYHEPSKGWCYTESTLRDIFGLRPDCPSNYDQYDELFAALRDCTELRDNLADFYFRSGDNGMPWGVWDPKYHPVGVVKVKPLV